MSKPKGGYIYTGDSYIISDINYRIHTSGVADIDISHKEHKGHEEYIPQGRDEAKKYISQKR